MYITPNHCLTQIQSKDNFSLEFFISLPENDWFVKDVCTFKWSLLLFFVYMWLVVFRCLWYFSQGIFFLHMTQYITSPSDTVLHYVLLPIFKLKDFYLIYIYILGIIYLIHFLFEKYALLDKMIYWWKRDNASFKYKIDPPLLFSKSKAFKNVIKYANAWAHRKLQIIWTLYIT